MRAMKTVIASALAVLALTAPAGAPAAPAAVRAHSAAACSWNGWTIYARQGISCKGARTWLRKNLTSKPGTVLAITCTRSAKGGSCGNIVNAKQRFKYRH